IRALREDAPDEAAAPDAAGAYLARQRSIHPAGIASFALRFDVPLDRPLFDLFMSTLLRLRGQDLLRVKGIVYFKGESQAQLIQGVCHVYDKPVALERDPDDARQSALVFIARNLERRQIEDYWQSLLALAH